MCRDERSDVEAATPVPAVGHSVASGSRFWKLVHVAVAILLGAALAGARRLFDWSDTTVLIVAGVIAVLWLPLALWTIFVKGKP